MLAFAPKFIGAVPTVIAPPTRFSRLGQAKATGMVLTRTGLEQLTKDLEVLLNPKMTMDKEFSESTKKSCFDAIPKAVEDRDKATKFFLTHLGPDEYYTADLEAVTIVKYCAEKASIPSNPWPWVIGGLGVAAVVTYLVWPK